MLIRLLDTQERELEWITDETVQVCEYLKHGLEDCYALLAPIDPGSTLVMSTPRNEKVKGTITRVGTRIVKGVRYILCYITIKGMETTVTHAPADLKLLNRR
jgi:hypothetical protein